MVTSDPSSHLFLLQPCLSLVWRKQAWGMQGFVRTLIVCAYSAYMFGWHVHEKAVLLITIPLT